MPETVAQPSADASAASAALRPLTPDDAPLIARIAGLLGDDDGVEVWRGRLAGAAVEPHFALGLAVEDQLVAYMVGRVGAGAFGLAGDTGFLEALGVHPAWQGRGVARRLAETLLDRFAASGVCRVLTLVDARDDRVQPFFRSLGFRPSQLLCLERRV